MTGAMPNGDGGSRGRRRWVLPVAIVTFLGLVAGGFVVAAWILGDESSAVAVELVTANDPGTSPFTRDVSAISAKEVAVARSAGDRLDLAAPKPKSGGNVRITTVSASTSRGVVYGSRQRQLCDIDGLAAALQKDPSARKAWLSLMGAPSVAEGLKGLTPLALTRDTAVNNSRYANGKAQRFLSVLQAGTPVLVDSTGVPRVKCSCGNPLSGASVPASVELTGKRWPGFDPAGIVGIRPASTGISQLTTVDVSSGEETTTSLDQHEGQDGPVSDSTSTTTAPVPSPTPAPTTTTIAPPPVAPSGFTANGYGPFYLGMSRSEAEATGWIVEAVANCGELIAGESTKSDLWFEQPGTDLAGQLSFDGDALALFTIGGSVTLPSGTDLPAAAGYPAVIDALRSSGAGITMDTYEEMTASQYIEATLSNGLSVGLYADADGWSMGIPSIGYCD